MSWLLRGALASFGGLVLVLGLGVSVCAPSSAAALGQGRDSCKRNNSCATVLVNTSDYALCWALKQDSPIGSATPFAADRNNPRRVDPNHPDRIEPHSWGGVLFAAQPNGKSLSSFSGQFIAVPASVSCPTNPNWWSPDIAAYLGGTINWSNEPYVGAGGYASPTAGHTGSYKFVPFREDITVPGDIYMSVGEIAIK